MTAGGTGSDTLTAVPGGTIGETSQYSGFKIFYHQSLGAGRTGITANLSAAANSEVTFWEIAGLANLTPDLTYNPFPGGTSTSAVSGTSGSLAAAVEAAFVFGDDEDSFKTGSTPFSAGAWNWDATSPDTGSAYGSQVTAATTGLATTIDQQSGSFLCEFLVVSFYAGAAPVALRRLPILGAGR